MGDDPHDPQFEENLQPKVFHVPGQVPVGRVHPVCRPILEVAVAQALLALGIDHRKIVDLNGPRPSGEERQAQWRRWPARQGIEWQRNGLADGVPLPVRRHRQPGGPAGAALHQIFLAQKDLDAAVLGSAQSGGHGERL